MHVISYRHCGDSANLAVRRASCRFPVGHDAENMPSRSSVSCVGGPGSSTDGRKRRLRRHTPSDARERTDNYSRSNPEPDPTSSPETYSRRPARRRTLRERERGDGAAETVIVMALLALIVLGLIQYAADEHGQQAAQAAASLALATARAQNGTAAAGQAAAQAELAQLTTAIQDTQVDVQRSADQVTVTITGTVTTLLGITQHLDVTAAGPVDKFEPDTQ
jgi:hypothetical protein